METNYERDVKMKSGKLFETEFKNSMPDIICERFNDGSSSWGGNNQVRFQATSPCDYIVFNGTTLFYLELKVTKGKSLSFANIKKHQIEDLTKRSNYKSVVCGFLIKFSDLAECYFVTIQEFNYFVNNNERKSIPAEYLKDKCLNIPMELKRTRYNYILDELFEI